MNSDTDKIEERTPSVETLSKRSFFIPSYQRGYRWTPDEVLELLEDIRRFSEQETSDNDEFYCLQPLVVKQKESRQWEVIDGQQRLTTIYLITRYMNEMWSGRTKDTVLTLDYESRDRTETFLKELAVKEDDTVDFNSENIDFAHISKAYQTIVEWANALGSNLDRYKFMSVFRHRVRVIWYEPVGEDSVKIFTRINRGKIPLTNAELIRGLFLKGSNFVKDNASASEREYARLRQMEISAEWDRIEAALHDEKFWYFLVGPNDPAETRIDLIFRLLTKAENYEGYGLFRAYAGDFPSDIDTEKVLEKWGEIKACFQQLQDWFLDWELYHWIGYLIATGVTLQVLWEDSRGLRKSEFKSKLKIRIKESAPIDSLDALQYGVAGVRNTLLLHNILTTLESKERQFRFPFNRYKKQKWDVEHIHSVSEKPPETEAHQREWLADASKHLDPEKAKDLLARIQALLAGSDWPEDEFEVVYLDVLKAFSESGEVESINDLSNLALLDSKTNRGYGNAVFPAKRAKIIQCEREGIFVPVATKNAFMKYYTNAVGEFTYWSEADRQHYFEAMQATFDTFFNGQGGVSQ